MGETANQRWENYYTPDSVDDALELLRRYDGRARVVGGGTDLLVETRRGLHKPVSAMVDVTHIAGLGEISLEDDYIVIGCGVTHSQVISDERIIELDDALSKLGEIDRRKSDVLVLHFFGGMTYEETAEVLDISSATVHRELRLAKAWLANELGND